jgi:hypothetical protein
MMVKNTIRIILIGKNNNKIHKSVKYLWTFTLKCGIIEKIDFLYVSV